MQHRSTQRYRQPLLFKSHTQKLDKNNSQKTYTQEIIMKRRNQYLEHHIGQDSYIHFFFKRPKSDKTDKEKNRTVESYTYIVKQTKRTTKRVHINTTAKITQFFITKEPDHRKVRYKDLIHK